MPGSSWICRYAAGELLPVQCATINTLIKEYSPLRNAVRTTAYRWGAPTVYMNYVELSGTCCSASKYLYECPLLQCIKEFCCCCMWYWNRGKRLHDARIWFSLLHICILETPPMLNRSNTASNSVVAKYWLAASQARTVLFQCCLRKHVRQSQTLAPVAALNYLRKTIS